MKTDFKLTRIACYLGYITQAIVINMAAVLFIVFHETYEVSYNQLGFLVFLAFVVQMAVLAVGAGHVDRLGYRFFAVFGHVAVAAGLVLVGVLPSTMDASYAGLLIAVAVYAVGGGLIEVAISPLVNALSGSAKSATMNFLHSFYCWGQVLTILGTTMFLQLAGRQMWAAIPMIWAAIPVINTVLFAKVALPDTLPERERMPVRSLFTSRTFVLIIVMILCAGAAETVIAQWSSLFAEEGLGYPKMVGDLLGPCLFAALMGVSRLLQALRKNQSRPETTLLYYAIGCVVCYVLIVAVKQPMIALLACAAFGFFVAIMWPGLLALNGLAFPSGGAASFGILAVFGTLGCAVGPWGAGIMADFYGLQSGLMVGLVFATLLAALLAVSKRKSI
ncbi:MAG: MFS transporter [Clostridiales bacterium]|nr:MFS transporter [Clostridiales bacterium]